MKLHAKTALTMAIAVIAAPVLAQPSHSNAGGRHSAQQSQNCHELRAQRQSQQPGSQRARGGQAQDRHYYNGRWVISTEWQRHSSERSRWETNNRRNHGRRNGSNSSSLLSGVIGFALGAAIVGSQQQAQHAQSADSSWDNRCAAKYRSYDRSSRTYLGYDGARHYCQ